MIILLGETAAAREIAAYLNNRGLEFERIQVWTEKVCLRMPSVILDASHPSSSGKLTTLSLWCEQRGITYLRLERPETKVPTSALIYPVYHWEEALLCLQQRVSAIYQDKGRRVTIFITTGSHQLESIVHSSFAALTRLVVRVLPEGRLVQKCKDIGINPKEIVAMQGPFSKEINRVLLKFYGADLLLTRDSGLAGGTDTKISAALELGLEIVLLKKAKISTGLTVNNVNELLDWVDNNIIIKRQSK
ncbi:precorrin-6A/cobalt-precorrin-6A reductase [Desulfosporosinus sp. OT]|uniref:precorrin-6A/cobalt-precorrin-6A reductase n=1 Tax=Desulfosporosinus sp. OT TaxID=913865 RepID=UPI000223A02C|nr:precorrin-6A/cobalt-precorrin-6A reductase [Desulfosporosinus sp. OT]EGW37995.1 precorrin-6x reductase CbiJ/CobK family protein [Desulfosporosinus sp. OT]